METLGLLVILLAAYIGISYLIWFGNLPVASG